MGEFAIERVEVESGGQYASVKHKNNTQLRTILLVDDDHGTRILTKWFLNNFGFVVDCSRSSEEALSRFDPRIHDVVITDNLMPGMSGTELAHIIKLRSPATPVLMFSGNPPGDHSCFDFVLQRPAHLMLLKVGIDQVLARPCPAPTSETASATSPS